MAKTIIQTIGPLYGDVVNGTVFGRPNGSVFVPLTNTISIDVPSEYVRIATSGARKYLRFCTSTGTFLTGAKMVAESQDIASYMAWEFADNVDFTDAVGRVNPAGVFNVNDSSIYGTTDEDFDIVDGTTYYVRGVLYASTGVPVAISDAVTVTGVVIE